MAMSRVRSVIIQDFESNFPQFKVADIFIPEQQFIIPVGKDNLSEPAEFYYGSKLFKRMARHDVADYKLKTEKAIYRSRVNNIKRNYGLGGKTYFSGKTNI